jgi:succinate dehydrogenase/fumarate reductase flavoprotein subunit
MAIQKLEADVAIIGSGAAGLMAALKVLDSGYRAVVVESDSLIGGATALSEGMVWVPNNPQSLGFAGSGAEEASAAVAYLRATSGNYFDAARAALYVEAAPNALAFVAEKAGLAFELNPYSRDYYPSAEGATVGRRALNPLPASMRGMDRDLFAKLRSPLGTTMLFKGMSIASQDAADYYNVGRSPTAILRIAKQVSGYLRDRLTGWPRGARLANGNVIVAKLAEAVRRRGGVILTDWTAEQVILNSERIVGLSGRKGMIRAKRGVVLASGGFNANHRSRAALVGRHEHIPIPAASTQRGLDQIVEGTGAAIVTDVSQPVLWAPASVVPASLPRSGPWPHFGDRAKPGVICLDVTGRRFTNEAQVYQDFVPAMISAARGNAGSAHCWIMCDYRAIRRYGLGPIGPLPVRLGPYLRSGYLKSGNTPAALASAIGLPPRTVEETIARFNGFARNGHDDDFGRGDSPYDRGNGDASHKPNPTLGPLEEPPFYAIRLVPGDIGTFVGLKVDAYARVLRSDGSIVRGLWAAGSAAAPLTGGTYPAAGLTIGQALTFAYVAAQDACTASVLEEAAE